jgi:hypothetical protein
MKLFRSILVSAASLAFVYSSAVAQDSAAGKVATHGPNERFDETGKTSIDGRTVPYLIRRLPVDSFPDLPDSVAAALQQRGCLIPQTWQAHRPENVIHASFDRPGSSDWAVLCSEHGNVDLLVFFARTPTKPITLVSVPEMERIQRHGADGIYGFDWGIDTASPERIREAQSAMEHHPPLLDHDSLADTVLNEKTVYHFCAHNGWTVVDVPE